MDNEQLKRHIKSSDLTALEKRYLEGLVEAQTPREGMRLIDADELELRKFTAAGSMSEYGRGWNDALAAVAENAPTIEAEPVRHGRWEKVGEIGCEYRCTNCKLKISMNGSARRPEEVGWNYCKGCGAKMETEV